LPDFLRGEEKGERIPLNFALLGQSEPRVYTISPGDLLGIYIRGLMPADTTVIPPSVAAQPNFTNIYYPPTGQVASPALGLPFEVTPEGNLNLPLIGQIPVAGLTLDQITTKVSRALVDKKVSVEGKEYVYLTMLRSAVFRVTVIRDEVQNPAVTFQPKELALMTRRGFAQVVDLPVNENDVLHALSISGGLPAFDAYNEVWVLRRNDVHRAMRQEMSEAAIAGTCLDTEYLTKVQFATATRIPLWIRPGESPTFSPEDVLLRDGDIVYILHAAKSTFTLVACSQVA
jgi:protein involved in polysaccharide export with SLBB domain